MWTVSPSRQASIGVTDGRAMVPVPPSTCWVSRSSSRNGSVRISMAGIWIIPSGSGVPQTTLL